MFNITTYQRNANQNYNKISHHTSQNGYHKKSTNKCWKGFGENRSLLPTLGGNVNWYSSYGEEYDGVSLKH